MNTMLPFNHQHDVKSNLVLFSFLNTSSFHWWKKTTDKCMSRVQVICKISRHSVLCSDQVLELTRLETVKSEELYIWDLSMNGAWQWKWYKICNALNIYCNTLTIGVICEYSQNLLIWYFQVKICPNNIILIIVTLIF